MLQHLTRRKLLILGGSSAAALTLLSAPAGATHNPPASGSSTTTTSPSTSGDLPRAQREVLVASSSQLTVALKGARPGDHIVLRDGSYGGTFALSAKGTASAPIVVRAQSRLRAKILDRFDLNGSYGILSGVVLDSATVEISGSYNRLSRCLSQSSGGMAVLIRSGPSHRVDHCEFAKCQGRGVSIKADPGTDYPRNPLIDRNYFHDVVGRQGTNEHEAVQIGQSSSHAGSLVRAVVEHNLFANCSVDPEVISIKSAENTVRLNTILDCVATLTNRMGKRNKIQANWIERSRGIIVMDRDIEVAGNLLRQSPGNSYGLRIMAGNTSPDKLKLPNGVDGYPYADNVTAGGNIADYMTVGSSYAGADTTLPARSTDIEKHSGQVFYGRQTGTSTQSSTSLKLLTPYRLSTANVGPNAA